jgi:hypothetical protein
MRLPRWMLTVASICFTVHCGSVVSELDRINNLSSSEAGKGKTPTTALPDAAAPTATPAAGTYGTVQNVSLSSTTSGANICYATTGIAPACDANASCTAGTSYTVPVNVAASLTLRAIACHSGYNASAITDTIFTIDTTPPTVLSSIPTNAATNIAPCTGSPCRGKIILVFSESMNTALSQTLTTEIWNGAVYVNAANVNTTFAWSTTTTSNDTLTINISWHWFPENSQIRYTLAASGLQDVIGNAIAAQVQRSFTTTTAKQAFAMADTGQAVCYNAAAVTGCGTDPLFPTQDGDVINVPTARSMSGPTLSGGSDYLTTDNVTTLVWRSCNEGRSGSTCAVGADTTMDWYSAQNQCSALNLANAGAGYGGRGGWRLPTKRELETLPRFGGANPASDAGQYPATAWGATSYWTSSTIIGTTANAWTVNFSAGLSGSTVKSVTTAIVRCVSTGTVTNASYTDNGDGTVTDNISNLRWQKCSRGQTQDATCSAPAATTTNWSGALQYCDALNLGAFANSSNWRLPNGNELRSLIDESVTVPAIKNAVFPNANNGNYWTSSTMIFTASSAIQINFINGTWTSPAKSGAVAVRCVATGP